MFVMQGNFRKVNFCQWCGGPTKHEIPDGDEKMRAICTQCGKVAYQNPKMVIFIVLYQCNKRTTYDRKIYEGIYSLICCKFLYIQFTMWLALCKLFHFFVCSRMNLDNFINRRTHFPSLSSLPIKVAGTYYSLFSLSSPPYSVGNNNICNSTDLFIFQNIRNGTKLSSYKPPGLIKAGRSATLRNHI